MTDRTTSPTAAPPASGDLRRQRRRIERYLRGGQPAAAQAILEELVRKHPGDADAGMQLGEMLRAHGHLQAATRQWLALMPHLPDDAGFIAGLVPHLYYNGETVAARRCFEHPAVGRTRDPRVLARLAEARMPLDEPADTLALLERALAAGADTPDMHFRRAQMLAFTGRIDDAEARLETIIEHWPTFGGAVLTLLRLRRQTDTRHLDRLRTFANRIPPDNIVHAEFQFALFKLLDDLGHHDEAWQALAAATEVMRALTPYDASADTALVDAIIRQSGMAGSTAARAHDDGPTPIFIVGMPRSGTTLLERMLSSHSQIASAGELKDFLHRLRWAADAPDKGLEGLDTLVAKASDIDPADLGRRYLEQTRWRAHGRRFYIDKLPNNYLFIHWIHQALPQAPILHIERDPMDVCFSNFKAMFGRASAWSYDMPALAHHHHQYRRLMDHWRTVHPGRILDVSYARLVSDPRTAMQHVLSHCGLEPEESCLQPARNTAPVSTPSNAQVREPIHARNLGAWQPYAQALEPLRRALEDLS